MHQPGNSPRQGHNLQNYAIADTGLGNHQTWAAIGLRTFRKLNGADHDSLPDAEVSVLQRGAIYAEYVPTPVNRTPPDRQRCAARYQSNRAPNACSVRIDRKFDNY